MNHINILDDMLNSTVTPVKRPRPGQGSTRTPQSRFLDQNYTPIPTPITNKTFAARPNPGQVIECFNSHLPVPIPPTEANQRRLKMTSPMDPKRFVYRYQFEKMSEKSSVLDQMIDDMAESFRVYNQLEEIADPTLQTQTDVVTLGRICPLSTTLTETSLALESSRTLGSGIRIPIKLASDVSVLDPPRGAGGFGVYPGALVAVKGRNVGGELVVKQVLTLPPPDGAFTRPSNLIEYQYGTGPDQLGGDPMTVIITAGPYTTDYNLDHEPLKALVEVCKSNKPDILVLIGPFVDACHPLIEKGIIECTPLELFKNTIGLGIKEIVRTNPKTTVLLVPNGRDLISHHYAFPQNPLDKTEFGLPPKNVKFLPNPASFSANEIMMGVVSEDVLLHLRKEEMFKSCKEVFRDGEGEKVEGHDLIGRACGHLLRQRSFYPLFPAPISKGDILNLDIARQDLLKMPPLDILITPSNLKPFVKIIDSTLSINPGHLSTKSTKGGTYAKMSVYPMEREELSRRVEDGDVGIEHRVWERGRVEIVAI